MTVVHLLEWGGVPGGGRGLALFARGGDPRPPPHGLEIEGHPADPDRIEESAAVVDHRAMAVHSLHDLILAHMAVVRSDAPPALVVLKPSLLPQFVAEDAAGGDPFSALFSEVAPGQFDFMGTPVTTDVECPSAVVFNAFQAEQWRQWRSDKASNRMFPAWDT